MAMTYKAPTPEQRRDIMLMERAFGIPDDTIGAAWDVTRQMVHQICGPRPALPAPPDISSLATPEALIAWRTWRKLSKAAAARRLGMAPATYRGMEEGRPTSKPLRALTLEVISHDLQNGKSK
jgi:hypothetical protein